MHVRARFRYACVAPAERLRPAGAHPMPAGIGELLSNVAAQAPQSH
jgi:hypothetical protein